MHVHNSLMNTSGLTVVGRACGGLMIASNTAQYGMCILCPSSWHQQCQYPWCWSMPHEMQQTTTRIIMAQLFRMLSTATTLARQGFLKHETMYSQQVVNNHGYIQQKKHVMYTIKQELGLQLKNIECSHVYSRESLQSIAYSSLLKKFTDTSRQYPTTTCLVNYVVWVATRGKREEQ